MNRRLPNYTLVLVLLMISVIALTFPPAPANAGLMRNPEAKQTDIGATVTALIRERDSILSTLTSSPKTPGGSIVSPTGTSTSTVTGNLPVGQTVTETTQLTATISPQLAAQTPMRVLEPTVEVIVDGLNIRSGPGVNYSIIGSAKLGAKFLIAGQVNNCGWLNITDADGEIGWISGAPSFVQFDGACGSLVIAKIPPTPTPRPATPTPRPSTAVQGATGCYLLQNQLGFELVINLRRYDGWSDTIRLPVGGEQLYCAAPATYSYTMTAPPPLGSINGEIVINAGDRFSLPLRLPNR